MKKLFSKITAAVIGLFTACAPLCAAYGEIYIGDRKAFTFSSTDENNKFEIKGMVNGEEVTHIFEVVVPSSEYYEQKFLMYKSGALARALVGPETFYNFSGKNDTMTKDERRLQLVKVNGVNTFDCIPTNVQPVAKITDYGWFGQKRIAYGYNPEKGKFCNELFKLRYYDLKQEKSRTLLNDYETKYHSGAVIKINDKIIGKIVGDYLPPCVFLYLMVIGAIEV